MKDEKTSRKPNNLKIKRNLQTESTVQCNNKTTSKKEKKNTIIKNKQKKKNYNNFKLKT